jgi:integrase
MASIRKRTWTTSAGLPKTAWLVDYTHQKKQHIKTFPTKRAADEWRAQMQHEVSRGTHTPASRSITVAEAGRKWIEQAETDGLEASTVMQYRQHLNLHILPYLADVRLVDLTPASIADFRNSLIRDGRKAVMAKKVLSSLGGILGNAMARSEVARNVVHEQAGSAAKKRERRLETRHKTTLRVGVDIPDHAELRAMLAAAQGRWRPLVVTAIFTGLRASELRGLTWSAVDLDAKAPTLTVRQRADRWNRIGDPKSDAGKREVPLGPMVVNTLREWKLACPKNDLDLVFPNGQGRPEQLSSIHYRGLGPLQKAAGISTSDKPKYGLHALRHAAASMFIEQGFGPKRVQALMGHSTIQMTFDTYGHLFPSPDSDQAEMRKLEARLVG